MHMKNVTIYTTPTCHFCNEAKEFFKENNVEYTSNDVSKDLAKRQEMIQLTGQLGVPVIVIDGKVIVGFDQSEVSKELGLTK